MIAIRDLPLLTLEEFWDWYPDKHGRYELINGEINEMQPTGKHEEVAGFIARKLNVAMEQQGITNWFIPRDCIIKPVDTQKTGYRPDCIVLSQVEVEQEPYWEKRSTITRGESVRLVIEVTSTNWRDDYLKKFADYEALRIPEYWIVDYLGLAAVRHIGSPKQPTISVFTLADNADEYELKQFRGSDHIVSPAFPELQLTAEQILTAKNK